MSNGKMTVHSHSSSLISRITHHLIFLSKRHLNHDAHPSLSATVSRLAAKIQTFRLLCPLPHTLSHRPMPVAIRVCPSTDHFLPGHETNFSVLPEAIRRAFTQCFAILLLLPAFE
jgi:hypothetical protein